MKQVAVIQFPGSNCVKETLAALKHSQIQAETLRWNASYDTFSQYQAYILPGGFSFQDRVRAGAISAKLPVSQWLQEADKKKQAYTRYLQWVSDISRNWFSTKPCIKVLY